MCCNISFGQPKDSACLCFEVQDYVTSYIVSVAPSSEQEKLTADLRKQKNDKNNEKCL